MQLPQLGPRTRRVLRYVGIGVFGLIVFTFALQMSLPFDSAKDRLIEALSPQYDITVMSVEPGWLPGRAYLNKVSIRTRPTKPEEPVTTLFLDRVEMNVGLLALVAGRLSVDIDASIGAGKLSGNVSLRGFSPLGGRGMSLRVTGHDLPSASLPAKLATNGLPMSGKIDLSLDFDLPKEKNKAGVVASDWSKAEGSLEIECPSGCNFGDGKSKWKPIVKNRSQQAMVSDGLEIESLEVAKLDAKLDIKEGHAKLTKLDVQSNDGEVHLDFDLKLAATLDESIVTGCVRFKTADGLFKRKPKADGAIRNTGAELRSDGYFHIKLADTWRDMKRLNAECGPNAKPDEHDAPGTGMMGGGVVRPAARPNLTVQPDEATHVRPGIPATPPQPIEPPGDAGAAPTPPPSAPSNGHLPGSEVEAPPAGSAGSAGAEGTGAASGGGPPNQVLQKR